MNLKLNLGCGSDILDGGWENIDLFPVNDRVIEADIRSLPYSPGTVAVIRAIDVIEHIPRAETDAALRHWHSLLHSGGTLEIRCPHVRKQAELLLQGVWSSDTFAHMMFGGQDTPGNFHMAGFDPGLLKQKLLAAGFKEVRTVDVFDAIPIAGNANFQTYAIKP